jgi:hypothetical protein
MLCPPPLISDVGLLGRGEVGHQEAEGICELDTELGRTRESVGGRTQMSMCMWLELGVLVGSLHLDFRDPNQTRCMSMQGTRYIEKLNKGLTWWLHAGDRRSSAMN